MDPTDTAKQCDAQAALKKHPKGMAELLDVNVIIHPFSEPFPRIHLTKRSSCDNPAWLAVQVPFPNRCQFGRLRARIFHEKDAQKPSEK